MYLPFPVGAFRFTGACVRACVCADPGCRSVPGEDTHPTYPKLDLSRTLPYNFYRAKERHHLAIDKISFVSVDTHTDDVSLHRGTII